MLDCEMIRLQNECYELLVTKCSLQNVKVTSFWLLNVCYKMFGYEMSVTSCRYEMSKLQLVWQP